MAVTPVDGSDLQAEHYVGLTIINKTKNHFEGAVAPADPAIGCDWYDTVAKLPKIWNGSAWQELASAYGAAPVGSIIALTSGYFGAAANVGFVSVYGNIAAINALLNPDGYYVADGSACNVAASPIWVGAGRYLPNISDSRFIMGRAVAGSTGGANTMAHVHSVDPPVATSGAPSAAPACEHLSPSWSGPTGAHTHTCNIAAFDSGAASDTENRPLYLALPYLVRVF